MNSRLSIAKPFTYHRPDLVLAVSALISALFFTLLSSAVAAKSLPDFENLVEKHAPTVVNIQSRGVSKQASNDLPQGQQMPEFLERFFQFQELTGPRHSVRVIDLGRICLSESHVDLG